LTENKAQDRVGVETTTIGAGGLSKTLIAGENKTTQIFDGTATLVGSVVITPGGSPVDGDTFDVLYKSKLTLNGNAVTIFGYTLNTQEALEGGVTVKAVYDGANAVWRTATINEVNLDSPDYDGSQSVAITATPANITLTVGKDPRVLVLTGTATLLNSMTVTANAPVGGVGEFWVEYRANITTNGNTITIFGIQLSPEDALDGDMAVHALWDDDAIFWNGDATRNQTSRCCDLYRQVAISAAQILAANSAPIQLIPAPTNGKAIFVTDVVHDYTFVTTAYTGNTDVHIITQTIGAPQKQDIAVLLSAISRSVVGQEYPSIAPNVPQVIPNEAIVWTVANGDPDPGGDGTVIVKLWYKLI